MRYVYTIIYTRVGDNCEYVIFGRDVVIRRFEKKCIICKCEYTLKKMLSLFYTKFV